jgi:hypothetical protein
MSACLLLGTFQFYIVMSVVFRLFIYTTTANSFTVGNDNVLLEFFLEGLKEVLIRS